MADVAMPHEQPLAGERILIVDDEHIIVLDLVETLTRAGASTLTARNSKGALRCLRDSHVSLAVLDIRLAEHEDCFAISDELPGRACRSFFSQAMQRRLASGNTFPC